MKRCNRASRRNALGALFRFRGCLIFALCALFALAVPGTAEAQGTPVGVSVSPQRLNVGTSGTMTVVITNTSTGTPVIEQATSTAVLTYTDAGVAKTVSASCAVYVQTIQPGGDWTGLVYAPALPAPLVADWSTAAFGGDAVNPRVDTSDGKPVQIRADRLASGKTWTTTVTVRNP